MMSTWTLLVVVCIAHPIVSVADEKDWVSFLPEDAKVPDFALPVKRQQKSVSDSVSSASNNAPQFSEQFPSQPFSVVVVPNMEGVESSEVVDMLRKELNITDHSIEDNSRESREFFFPNIQRSGSSQIIGNQLNHDSLEQDDNSNEVRHFQQQFEPQPQGNSFFVFNPNTDQSQFKSIDGPSSHKVFEQTVGIGSVQNPSGNYGFPVPESYKINSFNSDESDERTQAGFISNQQQSDLTYNVPFQTQYEQYSSRRVNEAQPHENNNANILLHRQASSFLRGSDESLEVLPNIQTIEKPNIIQNKPSFIQDNPAKSFVNGDLINSKSKESHETNSREDFIGHNPHLSQGLKEVDSSEFQESLPMLVHSLFDDDESKEHGNPLNQFGNQFRQDRLPDSHGDRRPSNEGFQQSREDFNSPEDFQDKSDEQLHGNSFRSHESTELFPDNSQERGDTICIDGKCFIKPDSHESEEFGKSLGETRIQLQPSQAGPNLFVVNHSPCFGEDCNQFQSQQTHTPPLPVFHQNSIENTDHDSSEEECDPTTIVSTSTTQVLDLRVSTIYSTVPQVVTVPTIVTSSMLYTETHTSIVEAATTSTSYVYDTSTVDITSEIVEPKTINVVTTEYPIQEVTHTHRHRYTEIVPVTITTTRTDVTRTNPVDYAVLRPVTETKTQYTTSNLLTTEVVTQYVTVTIMSPIPVFQTDSTVMTQTNIVTVTHDLYDNNQHIENSITVTVNPSPVTITQYKTSTTTYTKTIKSQVCSQNPYRQYGTPKFNHDSLGNAFFGNNLKSFDESTWPKDVKAKTSWQAVRRYESGRPSNYKIYSVQPESSAKLTFQRKREAGLSHNGEGPSNPELVSLVYAYGYGYPNFLERIEAVP